MVIPFIHPTMKLGKRMPLLDHRTLRVKRYINKAALPPPPIAIEWDKKVPSWPMYFNDMIGDCVPAGAGHTVQLWTGNANVLFTPAPNDILNIYESAGGYNPDDPSTDQGMFLLDMLKYWKKVGVSGHKLAGYMAMSIPVGASQPIGPGASVWPPKSQGSPKMWDELKQIVDIFGTAYIGLQLPLTAQDQVGNIWQVPKNGPFRNGSPGSWGGHCVPIVGYLPHAVLCVTWGAIQLISWSFLFYYMDEAWAPLSPDWIEKAKQVSPSGFNWQQLADDQQLVALKPAA